MLAKGFSKPTDRVERLRSMIVDAVPCIEAERAVLITESYQATEGLPMIMRRAKALENILNNLTVTIRDDELVVGSLQKLFVPVSFSLKTLTNGLWTSSIPSKPEWLTHLRFLKKIRLL